MALTTSEKVLPLPRSPARGARSPRARRAKALFSIIQALSLAPSMDEIRSLVASTARELTGADGATLAIRDRDECWYVEEDAVGTLWKGKRVPLDSCLSGWTMLHGTPAVAQDVYKDDRVRPDHYRSTFVVSVAAVPVRAVEPIAALAGYWAAPHAPTTHDVELLQALADATALALEKHDIQNALEASRRETLERLAVAAEYRDDGTQHHTHRVARTASMVAAVLGLPAQDCTLIEEATPLHDIGKLAIPDAILLKPGPLSADEFEKVKEHAEAGAGILASSGSEILRLAAEIALTHHEWWDGRGYPTGLAGDEIPISGRVVALADVFDALTHDRPYKTAWPVDAALSEIRHLTGRQFDPAVVAAFEELDPAELVELPARA